MAVQDRRNPDNLRVVKGDFGETAGMGGRDRCLVSHSLLRFVLASFLTPRFVRC